MSTPLTKEEAFARLGSITREMHEALTVLGGNQLHSIVEEIPNARDRLAYVGKMTEDAANKVLTLVEKAKPECDDLSTRGLELSQSLTRMAGTQDMSVDRAKGLLTVCGKFAESTAKFAGDQANVLSDIMMAQDFQDLSGQVIKKVVALAQDLESQLMSVLIETMPGEKRTESVNTLLNGPVINAVGRDDVVCNQEQVDDLLESLDF